MKLNLSDGRAVDYPRTPHDVTLSQYVDYLNNVAPTIPKEVVEYSDALQAAKELEKDLSKYYKKAGGKTREDLRAYLAGSPDDGARRFLPGLLDRYEESLYRLEAASNATGPLWVSLIWHPYQERVVKALAGIEPGDGATVNELQYLYEKCLKAIEMPKEVEYKQLYLHAGTVYLLPGELMKKSTLLEFAEAAQYESALKQAQGGDGNGLINMCAVLLRPKGVEQYSEEVFAANVQAFQSLPLQVAYEVSFFLTWLSNKYALDLQASMLAAASQTLD